MISQAEIRRRQQKAKDLNEKIRAMIEGDARLRKETVLAIWHGSLVTGRGGEVYDFDYAVFAEHNHCSEVLDYTTFLSQCVSNDIDELVWRQDVHFDGFRAFEAHTHWDLREEGFPHVGVHVFSFRALDELLGPQVWAERGGFVRAIDAWIRYGELLRNWVYEGLPVYDRDQQWSALEALNANPPDWLLNELESVVFHACKYRPQHDGHKSCYEGEPRVRQLTALLAYAIEGMPPGRDKRHSDDIIAMKNPLAQSLLRAAVEPFLTRASELLESHGIT